MKVGTAVIMWGAAGSAAGAVLAPTIASMIGGDIVSPVVIASVTASVALAAAIPLGWLLNRDVDRLRRSASRALDAGSAPAQRPSALLRSVSEPMHAAIEQSASETDSVMDRVRELEIHCRITDGERDRLEEVLESLQDAVVVTNKFGELKLANPAAAEILGLKQTDDASRSIDKIIESSIVRRLIHEAHDAGMASLRKRVEIELAEPGAEEGAPTRTYEATLACLPDIKAPIGGVVLILRDISREREISQMKSEFVSKASHELRTPLSSINAYVEMLLDGEATDEKSKAEFYQIIKNEADRLGRLIDNMLNISRIEAGIVQAQYEDIDFVKAATDAIEVIEPQAKLKDISIRVKSGPLLYAAEADRDMLQQVYLNLLSNAVKYTPEGGRVTVTVENDETTGSVMITVADTGLGIPPDALPMVFEKFYRIENYKRVAKGTGLGLSLVKHIVESVHNGQIVVTSELGMGSQFIVSIPYTRDRALGVAA